MKPILFSLPGNEAMGQKLQSLLDCEIGKALLRHFPDEETYVKIESDVKGKEVLLVCTLHQPDDKLLPLYFLAKTAMDLGAKSTTLIAPYLAYMRQDTRFQPGEGVTSTYFGALLSGFTNSLVTVDPHLHRHSSLSEVYQIPCHVVHAAASISDWIREKLDTPLIIGPDSESQQWVADVAARANAPYIVLQKVRRGDRSVEVTLPDLSLFTNHLPVLVDDIIATGKTMIEAVKKLKSRSMKPPVCIGVHGVFAANAYEELFVAGAGIVITSNTIPHPSNQIDLSPVLAQKILALGNTPRSDLARG